MKLKVTLATAVTSAVLATAITSALLSTGARAADPAPALKDEMDKISYSIGVNIGTSVRGQTQQQGLDVKPDLVAAGLRDALSGGKTLLTEDEVRTALMGLQQQMAGKQAALAEKNKKAGEVFLAENKGKPGVKTLPSGLQYQVLKEGKGQKPKSTDTVKANYRGTLIDGTEFDSSEPGEPVSFPLGNVIPGWTEALQLMPVGSKWRLFIPSDLAYGARGAGELIGPNSTLIFDVELLGVDAPEKP